MSEFNHRLDIPGKTYVRELNILANIASLVPENGKILEIGPCYGRSTHALYIGKPKTANLTTIDRWGGHIQFAPGTFEGDDKTLANIQNMSDAREGFEYCLGKEIIGNITVVQGSSFDFNFIGQYDLVFLDGDHSYEGLTIDICKHSKETLIICDDFSPNHEDVLTAAVENNIDRLILANNGPNMKLCLLLPTTGYWGNLVHEVVDIFVKAKS